MSSCYCVDEQLRRELLARRDEDQRIRTQVSPPVQERQQLRRLIEHQRLPAAA